MASYLHLMGRCRRFKIHKLLHNFNPVLSAQGTQEGRFKLKEEEEQKMLA